MRKLAVTCLAMTLASCSNIDEKIIGTWATNSFSPYYQDTLWISKIDGELVCKMYQAKGLIKQYKLDHNKSFRINEQMGCFPVDDTYLIRHLPKGDKLSLSISATGYENSAEYQRVATR